jgi:hypothetical protein
MPTPLKPPRGAFIATGILYHPDLTPAVKDTLMQLLGLAWRTNGRETLPLSLNQLSHLTGKPVKTLYGHIAVLRDTHSALRMQDAGDGAVIFLFADWTRPALSASKGYSGKPELPVKEEEEDFKDPLINGNNLLLNDQAVPKSAKKLHPRVKKALPPSPAPHPPSPPPPPRTALSDDLQNALLEAGVFPSLLLEVEKSGRAEDELFALLAWASSSQPDNPAPLFVVRLRAGGQPPPAFWHEPCRYCGERGQHKGDCPHRYLDGPYAGFIEH